MEPRQNCTICSEPAAASSGLNPGSAQKICFTNLCQLFNVNVNEAQVEILLGQNQNRNYKFCDGCYADLNQADRLYQTLKVLLDKLAQIKVGFERKILSSSRSTRCKNAIVDLIIREIRQESEPPETAAVTDSADSYHHLKGSNKEIEPAVESGWSTLVNIGQLSDLELKDSNEDDGFANDVEDLNNDLNEVDGDEV